MKPIKNYIRIELKDVVSKSGIIGAKDYFIADISSEVSSVKQGQRVLFTGATIQAKDYHFIAEEQIVAVE